MPSASRTINQKLAVAYRKTVRDPVHIAELRQQLRDAQLTEWVERELAKAPPPSQATKDKIAALLSGTTEPTA